MAQNNSATKTEVTVAASRPQLFRLNKRVVILGAMSLLVIATVLAWLFWPKPNNDALNKAEEHTLQTSLAIALNDNDDQEVVSVTTRLISGQKSGQFTLSNSTLATYYLDQANSFTNLKQYARAIPAYEEVPKLDKSNTTAALQGELIARYNAGQRKQLIPVLQQLVQLAKAKDYDQLSTSSAQYQADITALQHNQEITVE